MCARNELERRSTYFQHLAVSEWKMAYWKEGFRLGDSMRRHGSIHFCVLLLTICPSLLHAQEPTLKVSQRIVVSAGNAFRTNAVARYEGQPDAAIHLSRTHQSHRLLGAGIGFVAGVGLTYVITHSGGSSSLCDRSSNQDALSSGECLGLVTVGGIAGAGLGAIIGGLIKTEYALQAPIRELRVGIVPGHGMRLGLAGKL
jgi:hypothetical protein